MALTVVQVRLPLCTSDFRTLTLEEVEAGRITFRSQRSQATPDADRSPGASPLERAAPTSQKKVRANLHRPALGDSRIFTLEEVSTLDDPTRVTHPRPEKCRVSCTVRRLVEKPDARTDTREAVTPKGRRLDQRRTPESPSASPLRTSSTGLAKKSAGRLAPFGTHRLTHADPGRSESRAGKLRSRNARHATPGSG